MTTEEATIRARVLQASSSFASLDGVVLTTFGLHGPVFDEHVLPTVLGVESKPGAARRQVVHEALGETSVTVAYDPTTEPTVSGRYRYSAVPVPLLGRLFHPKIVVLAGTTSDGADAVWLGVGSANLTMSGWGRNAESFASVLLGHTDQQPVQALRRFLAWLRKHTGVDDEATADVIAVIDRLAPAPRTALSPDDGEASLYASVVHTEGFPAFLRRYGPLDTVEVFSPYWSDVPAGTESLGADATTLVAAQRQDNDGLGLARQQVDGAPASVEVRRNTREDGSRFWHAKAYRFTPATGAGDVHIAVGSCNFTSPGLAGGGGNVEMMLVQPNAADALPTADELAPCALDELATDVRTEEEAPPPRPVAIVVIWDWRDHRWTWWVDTDREVSDLRLALPGRAPRPIQLGQGSVEGSPPAAGETYTLELTLDGQPETLSGTIVEVNLDFSSRSYGRRLSATDILDSWRGRSISLGGDGSGNEDGEGDDEVDVVTDAPGAFEAFDLYDFYRSVRHLGRQLQRHAGRPATQRALLARRPDSLWALSRLVDDADVPPPVRFLVLHELSSLAARHQDALAEGMLDELDASVEDAKTATAEAIRKDHPDIPADEVLRWFDTWSTRLQPRPGAPA